MNVTYRFSGKNILIAGANVLPATSLALRFAEVGATVIVVDYDQEALLELASHAPSQIEPIFMRLEVAANIDRLAQIWTPEPIHVLAQFQPYGMAERLSASVGSVVRMSRQLAPCLARGPGVNIVAIPKVTDPEDPIANAREAAHLGMLRAMRQGDQGRPLRTIGLLGLGPETCEGWAETLSQRIFDTAQAALDVPASEPAPETHSSGN